MTTLTATATPTQRVRALAPSEIRLIVRNRTVAVASILIPLALRRSPSSSRCSRR